MNPFRCVFRPLEVEDCLAPLNAFHLELNIGAGSTLALANGIAGKACWGGIETVFADAIGAPDTPRARAGAGTTA
jgi:hypothetical protein